MNWKRHIYFYSHNLIINSKINSNFNLTILEGYFIYLLKKKKKVSLLLEKKKKNFIKNFFLKLKIK